MQPAGGSHVLLPVLTRDGAELNREVLKETQVVNAGEKPFARLNPAVVLIDHPVR